MGFYSELQNAGFERTPGGGFAGDPNSLPPELRDSPLLAAGTRAGNIQFTEPLRDPSAPASNAQAPMLPAAPSGGAAATPKTPDGNQPDSAPAREQMLRNLGLLPRRKTQRPDPRQNPQSGKLNDGSRPPLPFDPLDPTTINDVARQIQQAAQQTESVSLQDRLFALEKRVETTLKWLLDIWPPMPHAEGGESGIEFVMCYADGGDNGDDTHKPTYTYSLFTLDGALMGTGISVASPREVGLLENPYTEGPWLGIAMPRTSTDITLYLIEPKACGPCPCPPT